LIFSFLSGSVDLNKLKTKNSIKILIIFLFVTLSINSRQYWGFEFGFGINEKKNPVSAIEFMKKMNMKGNLYSPLMEAHNYVLFEMNPEIKVFIDGRIPLLYPVSFLELFNSNSVTDLQNKGYKIDIILITNGIYSEKNSRFVSDLMQNSTFKLVHFTENDALFINNSSFEKTCSECIPYEIINPWKMIDDRYIEQIRNESAAPRMDKEIQYYKKMAQESELKNEIIKIAESLKN